MPRPCFRHFFAAGFSQAAERRPNILFIAIDDLNHWVGHLGHHPQTKTPNLDRLAAARVKMAKRHGEHAAIVASGRWKEAVQAYLATEAENVPDHLFTDGSNANLAIKTIQNHDTKQPLFLAVGFTKPHLPFVAPKKYWDLYDRSKTTPWPTPSAPHSGATMKCAKRHPVRSWPKNSTISAAG